MVRHAIHILRRAYTAEADLHRRWWADEEDTEMTAGRARGSAPGPDRGENPVSELPLATQEAVHAIVERLSGRLDEIAKPMVARRCRPHEGRG